LPLRFETPSIGFPFIELQSVDSTNTYLMQMVRESQLPGTRKKVNHGMAVFAHEQRSGKGRRGKQWQTEKGKNIILSLLINTSHHYLHDMFPLSACAAVAAVRFLNKYTENTFSIKWPNDIYWQQKKAGGILIENVLRNKAEMPAEWKWAVTGIGINVNQTSFPKALPNPVSLKQITGKTFDPVLLAKEFCKELDLSYSALINGGFEEIHKSYNNLLFKQGEKVKLKENTRVFEATIKSVNRSGQLVVQHAVEECFDFGKLEWLL